MTDFITSGEWTSVVSSNVSEAMYDADREQLSIRFHSGRVYHYVGVPASMAAEFIRAPSKGIWVHRNLVVPEWSFIRG